MSQLKVLYVDDEADIREIAVMSLELDPDIEVLPCSSGHEAVEKAQSWQPSLILLDVMMPGMDGPGTLEVLRSIPATQAIPVIFITARAQSSEVATFRAMDALGVIAKPFNPMMLAEQVRALLDQ